MIYTLHHNREALPHEKLGLDHVRAVPEKLAPLALFFPALWLLFHRLWFAFGVYMVLVIFLAGLWATAYWPVALALGVLPGLYLWLEGHQLRRQNLQRKGFQPAGVVEAPDEQVAMMKYLQLPFAGDVQDAAQIVETA